MSKKNTKADPKATNNALASSARAYMLNGNFAAAEEKINAITDPVVRQTLLGKLAADKAAAKPAAAEKQAEEKPAEKPAEQPAAAPAKQAKKPAAKKPAAKKAAPKPAADAEPAPKPVVDVRTSSERAIALYDEIITKFEAEEKALRAAGRPWKTYMFHRVQLVNLRANFKRCTRTR